MKLSRKTAVCLSVLLLLIAGFFVLQACSFRIMTAWADIDYDTIEYLTYRYKEPAQEVTVFSAYTTDGELTLVRAVKNLLGFWSVSSQEITGAGDGTDKIVMGWFEKVHWGPALTEQDSYVYETHKVYCGRDAVDVIVILPEQIPGNITVNIGQYGSDYLIHVVHFGDVSQSGSFDVWEILRENGCIKE